MNRYERRRLRLIEIRDLTCKGSVALLAQKLGKSESYVGRMLWPEGRTGRKNIGEVMAAHIEQELGLPEGFLDSDSSVSEYLGSASSERVNSNVSNYLLPKTGQPLTTPKGSLLATSSRIPPMPYPVSPEAYYLTVQGPSMQNPGNEPSLNPGDLVLVDPHAAPENMSLVAVNLPGATDPIIRQFVVEAGVEYLRAVNPQWPSPYVEVPEGAKLAGRVVTKLVRY